MADPQDLEISFCHPIGTRDGTLTKDARMINCFIEETENGNALVKRPGTSFAPTAQLVTGIPQGLLMVGNAQWYIINDVVYSVQLPASAITLTAPTIPHSPMDTLSNVPLNASQSWIKSEFDLYSFNGGGATKVTDTNWVTNAPYVTGFVFLDGVFYAMTINGRIIGSALNDATVWPTLDFVQSDYTYGGGAAIHRHLNYVIGFYAYGTQVYWDANAAPNGQGIALNPVLSSAWTTGCIPNVNPVELSDNTFFMSQSLQYGRGVHMIQGLSLVKVSTPFIDKILNRDNVTAQTPFAFGIKISGRENYVLTLPNQGISLVYDLVTQQWSLWSSIVSGTELYFQARFYLNDGAEDVMQDLVTGRPIIVSPDSFTDVTGNIPVTSYTPPMDWGSLNWKRFGYNYLLADTISTTVSLSFSDNDYQTFSNPRTVDLSTVRKQMRNCGSSRRRIWKLTHSDNTPLRVFTMKSSTTGLPR